MTPALSLFLAASMAIVGFVALAGDGPPPPEARWIGGAFFAGAAACLFIAVWEIVT